MTSPKPIPHTYGVTSVRSSSGARSEQQASASTYNQTSSSQPSGRTYNQRSTSLPSYQPSVFPPSPCLSTSTDSSNSSLLPIDDRELPRFRPLNPKLDMLGPESISLVSVYGITTNTKIVEKAHREGLNHQEITDNVRKGRKEGRYIKVAPGMYVAGCSVCRKPMRADWDEDCYSFQCVGAHADKEIMVKMEYEVHDKGFPSENPATVKSTSCRHTIHKDCLERFVICKEKVAIEGGDPLGDIAWRRIIHN